jgi:putative transposase
VTHLVTQGGLPVQRACQAVGLSRATYYRPVVNWALRDGPVIESLTVLSTTNPRWGFWKYVDRLRLTGHRWNHKRLWRVYADSGSICRDGPRSGCRYGRGIRWP